MNRFGMAYVGTQAVFTFALMCPGNLAQTAFDAGAIRGTVRDDSGALVPAAAILLTEESKGVSRKSQSDGHGTFLFTSLTVGAYSLRVEKEGFTTERFQELEVEVGEQVSLAVTLHLGSSRTEVTIRAPDPAELNAESNTLGSVIDFERVQHLPLNGRYFLELAQIAAGTASVNAASNLFTTNIGPPGRTIVLPGTLPNAVNYYLNGVNVTGPRDGELSLSPSIAAIDEFKIQQNFLMPDEGINPALVNIVTKSGSNRYHGQGYEFFRNRSLDARSFFAVNRDDVKLNQFGGAAGGPVNKNRVWFYGFYEGLREITAFPLAGYTPTAGMFSGNFTGAGTIIYDPNTYNAFTNTREPFPNQEIPITRLNSVSQNLLKYYLPGSSFATTPTNVSLAPRYKNDDDQGGLRLDAALGPRSLLFGQFFRQRSPSDQPGLFPLSGLLYTNSSDLMMIQHAWILSPRTVNIIRLGFLRNIALGGNEAQSSGPIAASIGVMNTFANRGVTAINLQGYSSFGRANGQVGNQDNTWTFDEELTYSHGAHTFASGMDLAYRRGWHLNGNGSALGTLSFQPVFTAQLTRNAQGQLTPLEHTGSSFADFLLGDPVSGMLIGLPVVQLRATQFTPFVQDTWRLARNLTLNYGLSWFVETPPEPQGWARQYVHSFDFKTGLLAFAALGQTSDHPVATRKNNLSPRVGIAWKPDSLKSWVFRAAAGIYYVAFPWVLAADSVQGPPAGVGQTFTNPLSSPTPTFVLGTNIFPPTVVSPLTSTYAASLPPGTAVQALDPNFHTASVNQWNVSIQRSIGVKDSFELKYLGSSGHHLPNLSDPSQCRPDANLFCDPASRPYPRYGLILYADSSGNSSYEGLISSYHHRVASGFNIGVEYAFSKALTDSWQSSLTINQISSCRQCSKGPATFDVRQRAVASFVWKLPVIGTQRPWLNAATNGWWASAIITIASGQPIILTAPNETGSAFISSLPNRNCDGRSSQLPSDIRGNGLLWFNTACFSVPSAGHFGNSGATPLNGPGLDNWDLGLEKAIAIVRDIVNIDLRVEMFNAWNHTEFEQPNGNTADKGFGRITATLPPRLIQVALKLGW